MTTESKPVTSLVLIFLPRTSRMWVSKRIEQECRTGRLSYIDIITDEQLASLSQINNNAPLPDILNQPASISWYTHKAMKRWVWSANKFRKSQICKLTDWPNLNLQTFRECGRGICGPNLFFNLKTFCLPKTSENPQLFFTNIGLKVPSHQIRLGLKWYGWIGLGEYKDCRWLIDF